MNLLLVFRAEAVIIMGEYDTCSLKKRIDYCGADESHTTAIKVS